MAAVNSNRNQEDLKIFLTRSSGLKIFLKKIFAPEANYGNNILKLPHGSETKRSNEGNSKERFAKNSNFYFFAKRRKSVEK